MIIGDVIMLADRYVQRSRLKDALELYQKQIDLMKVAAGGGDDHPSVLDFEQRVEQLVSQISDRVTYLDK